MAKKTVKRRPLRQPQKLDEFMPSPDQDPELVYEQGDENRVIDIEPTKLPLEKHDRLTARFTLYHQHKGEDPDGIELIMSSLLETNVELWKKRKTATEEWRELALGDYADEFEAGYMVIKNLEGEKLTVHPSEEDKAELRKRVIEVAFEDSLHNVIELPPACPREQQFGGFAYFRVNDARKLRIRCREGQADYRILVTPR